jgi:hypothetical protein
MASLDFRQILGEITQIKNKNKDESVSEIL